MIWLYRLLGTSFGCLALAEETTSLLGFGFFRTGNFLIDNWMFTMTMTMDVMVNGWTITRRRSRWSWNTVA